MSERTCGTCAAWRTLDGDEQRTRDGERYGWCHMHPPTHDGHPSALECNGCMQHTPATPPQPSCELPWLDAATAPDHIDGWCMVYCGTVLPAYRRVGRWYEAGSQTMLFGVTHYLTITPPVTP